MAGHLARRVDICCWVPVTTCFIFPPPNQSSSLRSTGEHGHTPASSQLTPCVRQVSTPVQWWAAEGAGGAIDLGGGAAADVGVLGGVERGAGVEHEHQHGKDTGQDKHQEEQETKHGGHFPNQRGILVEFKLIS